jgi:hypothetical protein
VPAHVPLDAGERGATTSASQAREGSGSRRGGGPGPDEPAASGAVCEWQRRLHAEAPLRRGETPAAGHDGGGRGGGGVWHVWRLPDDVRSALAEARAIEEEEAEAAEAEAARRAWLQRGVTDCYQLLRPVLGFGAAASGGAMGPGGGSGANAETQRLLGDVLAAARRLARVRAGHRSAFGAALEQLPPGVRVLGA